MIPKTKKLFISYRSSDAAKVDKIARDLNLLKYDDGTSRYTTWQDKHNLPPASPNWWDAIVDAIIDCDVFVFNMSKASLQSEVCQAELDYAYKRNRPIIPVVLEDEFFLDPKSGKYNITYWDLVPDWLREVQFLFVEADFYSSFQAAIDLFERNWPRDINVPRPINPDSKSVHGSNHALYDAACDYAERLAFEDARKHFNTLVRRSDKDYADIAAQWLELLGLYAELIEIDQRRSARFIFNRKWTAYQALFPKDFLDGIFDPKGFSGRNGGQSTPVTTQSVSTAKPTSLTLMPAPFDWIEIPKKGYRIAKYPVTNAQFATFIEAGGYKQQKWWTQAGWEAKAKGWAWNSSKGTWEETGTAWTQPRYWTDSQWNGEEQPVGGVSWYEAVAFCLWLSDVTGENIMLPTEDQWQYAAQGDDDRDYPWGKKWDASRCNNNVYSKGIGKTTPVRQYEGKGDSAFGVVDMAGNVWEWCLTDYNNKTNDINSYAKYRVLRGGSWGSGNMGGFRCDFRGRDDPHDRNSDYGIRISRS
ncbi:MAG: SUMF1/EgtB/PvdO family nonheme iron enzyme [Anaerolineae bacterium]|nr:SUMF1/EgtB/PvdO family nonheme iron enzyme [Anaerolineae bacterium]